MLEEIAARAKAYLIGGTRPSQPQIIALTTSILAMAVLWLWQQFQAQRRVDNEAISSKPSKNQTSEPFKWIPQDFKRPTPAPYPSWSIEKTKPMPYRPFRYGPKFFITMGLRTVPWDEWIELDNLYPQYHTRKAHRIAERGLKCSRSSPEGFEAAVELLEELCSYLPERYPSLFRATDTGIENLWSGEKFNIKERPLAEDPMQMCGRLIQDDMSVLVPREDGQYYLLAGSILLAGFWRLEDKFGMSLSEVHYSGEVPQYKEKLEKGILNFFRRLKPRELYARNTYFIQVDEDIAWSHSIGNEDDPVVSWDTAQKNKAIEHHHLRAERQTLRRLPKSGAIIFVVRTYFHPITEVAEEDYVPGRLASAIRSWGDDVAHYKGRERYGEVLLEYLDRKHQEQIDRGLQLDKEDEVRKFPY